MNQNHQQLVEMLLSEINNLARIHNAKPREITQLGDGDINRLLAAVGLPWEEGSL
ncbi:hypothetical protein BDZ91DRAFT_746941 [Kalaharituber pfeilii]|nr:hypothetical protein BDZ91DRAFT_746941 [Kalaharituber pfeilii]